MRGAAAARKPRLLLDASSNAEAPPLPPADPWAADPYAAPSVVFHALPNSALEPVFPRQDLGGGGHFARSSMLDLELTAAIALPTLMVDDAHLQVRSGCEGTPWRAGSLRG